MYFLVEATAENPYLPVLALVGVVGFIAAALIGSIAWYNSKRPEGWNDRERPHFVPNIEK